MYCLGLEDLCRQSRAKRSPVARESQVSGSQDRWQMKSRKQQMGNRRVCVRALKANLIYMTVQPRARATNCCCISHLSDNSKMHMHSLSKFIRSFAKLFLTEQLKETTCSFIKHKVSKIRQLSLRSLKLKSRHLPFAKCKGQTPSTYFSYSEPRKQLENKGMEEDTQQVKLNAPKSVY